MNGDGDAIIEEEEKSDTGDFSMDSKTRIAAQEESKMGVEVVPLSQVIAETKSNL